MITENFLATDHIRGVLPKRLFLYLSFTQLYRKILWVFKTNVILRFNAFRVQEKLKGMLRRWAEGDFKGDPQLALIPSLYNQLIKEGIDFSSASGSSDVSIYLTMLHWNIAK